MPFSWLTAAALTPGESVIENAAREPEILDLAAMLRSMGADITESNFRDEAEPMCDLTVKYSRLHGVEIGGSIIPRLIDELPVLAVFEVAGADLDEEQNGQDHIAHGKDHVVDDGLDLRFGCLPCFFDGAGHIAGRKCGHGKRRRKDGHEQKGKQDPYGSLFFRFH